MVDAVGEGVADLTVGDRVWIYLAGHQRPTGTAQEYTNLPAARVVRLPDEASFDVGANLGVPAMTAHRALTVSEDGPDRLHPGALAARSCWSPAVRVRWATPPSSSPAGPEPP